MCLCVCVCVCDSACFGRLEEMCSCLLSMQVQLQRMWDEKGAKLDQVVQLRKYEHDSAQVCGILPVGHVVFSTASNSLHCSYIHKIYL